MLGVWKLAFGMAAADNEELFLQQPRHVCRPFSRMAARQRKGQSNRSQAAGCKTIAFSYIIVGKFVGIVTENGRDMAENRRGV